MNRACQTPGCQNPHRARGYCSSCYARARADGTIDLVLPRRADDLCATCRTNERMRRGSYCRQCASGYERERRTLHATDINARRKASYDPRRNKEHKLRRYGLTLDQFELLVEQQRGACAVCGCVMIDLFVDHDHACCPERFRSCGKCIRGLLCTNCNAGLGQFGDDISRLMSAAAYLLRTTDVMQRAGIEATS